MAIGSQIRKRREELGMSQDELAKKVGYSSRSSINKIEKEINDVPQSKILEFAKILGTTVDYLLNIEEQPTRIPVLGTVKAGIPITAVQEILDYEEISSEMARCGEYFALRINGDSMEPRMHEGDVVIVKQQSTVDSGQIAIVLVNGDEATVKKVRFRNNGIELIAFNSYAYEPHFYSAEEIRRLPVEIIGRVVELRAKF